MDTERIERALRKLRDQSVSVASWRIETGPDATDDPSVWVWVILESDIRNFDAINAFRERVRKAVLDVSPDAQHAYVRFRTVQEESA